MIRSRIRGAALLAAALAAAAAQPASAQSLLSARGLGYTLDPVNARARGLGGVGLGLPESTLTLVNPAELAGLPVAGLSVTFQSDGFSPDAEGVGDLTTARFPAIQVAFPFGQRFVASVGYAALLDQTWTATREDSLELAGATRLVQDRFASRGGLSRLRIGGAYRLARRVDVGVGVDLYTGALRDSVTRTFPDGGLFATQTGTDYEYQGLGASAGVRYRGPALTLSAALTAAGDLTVEPGDSAATERTYALPVVFDAGASARVTQNTLLAASFRWSGWSRAEDDLANSGGSRDAMQAAGGLEYEGLRFLGRPVPVRLGARWAQLPFHWESAADYPEERAVTGGLGILFAGGAASVDLSGERGSRGGGSSGFDEPFWRVSASLSLLAR